MQKTRTIAKAIGVITIVLMIVSTLSIINVSAQQQLAAQQPVSGPLPAGATVDVQAYTKAYLSFRPNPVGLGQPFLVNLWVTPAPGAQRQYLAYKVTITKPDGTTQTLTMDSYVADGTAWFEYVADQVGEWKLKWEFPGIYFPAGRYFEGKIINATSGGQVYSQAVYCPPDATEEQKLTVQEDIVWSWPPAPLPTDYWTRPVNEENREWWPILGNYPWYGPGGGSMWDQLYPNTNPYANPAYAFVPWVQGPNSPHVVWKREYSLGGLLGGDLGAASSVYWSDWYNRPTIILAGRGYQAITKPSSTGPSGQTYWQSYDLRTGEIFWERPLFTGEAEPTLIEYGITSLAVPGVQPKPDTPYIMSISNGYLRKYEVVNGYMLLNVSIAPLTGSGGTYYRNGYCLAVQDLGATAGANRYRLINWTTFGTATSLASRIVSNTTYGRSSLPGGQTTDYQVGIGTTIAGVDSGGIRIGQRIESYDLATGTLLWNKTTEEPQYSGASNVADHGKIAILSAKGYYVAYDLRTGTQAWKTKSLDYPWDEPGWGSYSVISAYGKLYWFAQTGIYAIDWDTGNIDWKYEIKTPFPYETEYTSANGTTVYPFHAPGICADGKIYAYACEHSPETPFYRGLPTLCINATTGELIWKIAMSGSGQHTRVASQLRVADGYLTLGTRDGYMYVFGKGKSQTTVTAPDTIIAKGSGLVIKGTVLDISPAQPNTPCVSKDSMTLQMEHIHMQTAIDGIWHNETLMGVPVSLTAVGSDGSYVDLGTVTTDGYYGTFSKVWTPDKEGDYKIIASFAGDDSYGSSAASTAVSIGPAPAGITIPEQIQPIDYTMTIIAGVIAVIIVVAIATILLYRKR
ncbi:MAG TPA: PQQ-binding-like beta-propeller repeat protein [Candidatus Sulfotelmatobacter sp.]|nr:PQQ-binding-like beta-propeller repeat protein [Candidatus Sulfotelmatobacter sp.]